MSQEKCNMCEYQSRCWWVKDYTPCKDPERIRALDNIKQLSVRNTLKVNSIDNTYSLHQITALLKETNDVHRQMKDILNMYPLNRNRLHTNSTTKYFKQIESNLEQIEIERFRYFEYRIISITIFIIGFIIINLQ